VSTAASPSPEPASLVRLRGVTKVYGSGSAAMWALRGIDLDIDRGEFIAVMGPSGSGKSTCMNILGCLDTPTAGSFRFRDVEVTGLSRTQRSLLRRFWFGFIFQGYNLLPRTSAIENVELPLMYRGSPPAERAEQQQRVAIARAVVSRPALLLADEPTGNLDSARSVEIMELLARFNREQGITIVMVTHEPEMALFARRTVRFVDGLVASDEVTG
jgi:putative ABC transport system ATP-binding protein